MFDAVWRPLPSCKGAGSVAEHLWHRTPKGAIGDGDYQDMVKGGLRGEDFRIIWEETSRLLCQLKPKVWRLAAKLHRQPGKRIRLGR